MKTNKYTIADQLQDSMMKYTLQGEVIVITLDATGEALNLTRVENNLVLSNSVKVLKTAVKFDTIRKFLNK
tara:strand:- start:314 stop:526 length:213 start_codon:yes stop_codon:yes gene_type:complete